MEKFKKLALFAILAALFSVASPSFAEDEDPHAQLAKVINQLNQANPFAQVSPTPNQSAVPIQLPPDLEQRLHFVQKILSNPYVQKYMRIVTDPRLQGDIHAIANHPQRLALIGWEVAWIVIMFVFKAWRLSKSRHFLSMLVTQLWTFALFTFGIVLLVPRMVLGVQYEMLIRHLIQVIQG